MQISLLFVKPHAINCLLGSLEHPELQQVNE